MSFWDNVKKFTQPYSDEEYDDYDEDEAMDDFDDEAEQPASRSSRRSAGSSASFSSAPDSGLDFGATSAPAASGGFSGQVLNMNTSGSRQEVVLFHAKAFDDAAKASDELRSKKAVILNMENVDKALTRRVVDFLSGCVYALDGKVRKIAQSTYLFCPHSMEIVGDLENYQAEVDSYV